jgi:glutamate synthase (NADPH/NADH) large chain
LGIELPELGKYGTGFVFFPQDETKRNECKEFIKQTAKKLKFTILGYRKITTDNSPIGPTAKSAEPVIEQLFIKPEFDFKEDIELERKAIFYVHTPCVK